MMNLSRFEFDPLERAAIAASLIVFLSSAILYVTDFKIGNYFLDWNEEEKGRAVGILAEASGQIKRKIFNDTSFETIKKSDRLYNSDTVVTGPDGAAVVQLDDGSSIELGPKTMVKLAFESSLSFGGIARETVVNIVSGKVKAKTRERVVVLRSAGESIRVEKKQPTQVIQVAPIVPRKPVVTEPIAKKQVAAPKEEPLVQAPPVFVLKEDPPAPALPDSAPTTVAEATPEATVEPTPSAIPSPVVEVQKTPEPPPAPVSPKVTPKIKLVAPVATENLRIADGSVVAKKPLVLTWNVEATALETRVKVTHVQGAQREDVFDKKILSKIGKNTASLELDAPGSYEWEVRPEDKDLQWEGPRNSRFELKPDFEGIHLLTPLIGGKEGASNVYTGTILNEFDITLRWKDYDKVNKYRLQVYTQNNGPPVLEREIETTNYRLNRDKVFKGQVFYKVTARHPKGFVITSKTTPFRFDFMPPVLVLPKHKNVVKRAKKTDKEQRILFTWQKTNFTEYYQLEMSQDAEFEKISASKQTKENFLIIETPKAGNYYWRVSSHGRGVASLPTAPRAIQIIEVETLPPSEIRSPSGTLINEGNPNVDSDDSDD